MLELILWGDKSHKATLTFSCSSFPFLRTTVSLTLEAAICFECIWIHLHSFFLELFWFRFFWRHQHFSALKMRRASFVYLRIGLECGAELVNFTFKRTWSPWIYPILVILLANNSDKVCFTFFPIYYHSAPKQALLFLKDTGLRLWCVNTIVKVTALVHSVILSFAVPVEREVLVLHLTTEIDSVSETFFLNKLKTVLNIQNNRLNWTLLQSIFFIYISLLHNYLNGSGAHPASYEMSTKGSFPGFEADGA